MENEMTLEQMEMALTKCGTHYPEILDVIVMLQQNDLRNSESLNKTVDAVDKAVDTMTELTNTVQEMSNIIYQLKERIDELEEQTDELEEQIDELEEQTEELEEQIEELEEQIDELEDDNMDNTVQMCDEVVEAIENNNEDDFMNAYMKLTESLKQEVIEDMKNEEEKYGTEIKEMEYADKYEDCQERNVEILCDDTYKGYRFIILDMSGSHPCAYVEIPKEHPKYGATDRDWWHVGSNEVTYGRNYLTDILSDTWVIGWDYHHAGDYSPLDPYGRKWTTHEIIEECHEAIEDLIFMESDE